MRRNSTSRRGNRENSQRSSRGSSRRGNFHYERRSADDIKRRQEKGDDNRDSIFKENITLFTPAKGENCIRILPPTWEDSEHFGLDVYVHYGIGADNSAYLCPIAMKTSDRCCVCEERQKAERDGDKDYMQELSYSHRVMYYLLDRDEEKEKQKVWAAPFASIDKQITTQLKASRSGEILYIDDPEDGYDVLFDKEGEKMKTKYSGIRIDRHSSDLGRFKDEILDNITEKPLPELLNHALPEDIETVFFGGGSQSNEGRSSRRNKKSDTSEADFSANDVFEMGFDELEDVIEEYDLALDASEYTDDEIDDLSKDIVKELNLEEDTGRGNARRAVRDRG